MALLIGNVVVDFYNEEGNHISILYSDSARINEQSNNIHANGNVYVVSDPAKLLAAGELSFAVPVTVISSIVKSLTVELKVAV